MRIFLAILAWMAATPALAQPSALHLTADPVPIIEATINRRPVRLQVDPRMPDALTLNASAAQRLGVRNLPMVRARIVLDDASLLTRLARPEVRFANGRETRAMALIFATDLVEGADGVIGPGALAYDTVTISFGAPRAAARTRRFTLADPDLWFPSFALTPDSNARFDFNLTDSETMLNRPALHALERARLVVAAGELAPRHLIFGMRTSMQPAVIDSSVTFDGLALGPAMARTNAPIIGDEDTIIVEGEGEGEREPRVSIGRAALSACWSISVDRATRQLTLVCAE
jgi:hypothetical protein